MSMAQWVESYGHDWVLAAAGAGAGLMFGFMGQRSKFCLRAAVIEFWHRKFGEKLIVWLLAFSSAVMAVQSMTLLGWLDTSSARQIASTGSLSGALVGGLIFGAGMVMTRGCASRLLVLSANGNLRALLAGLIFAVAAQSALSGALSPLRLEISSWWTVEGDPHATCWHAWVWVTVPAWPWVACGFWLPCILPGTAPSAVSGCGSVALAPA